MLDSRIDDLLNAYFHRPLEEYAEVVTGIKGSGGLTAEEVKAINSRLRFIDACTIVRQAGASEMQSFAQRGEA